MFSLPVLLFVGLLGSLLMFAGDMLLYFTRGAYDMDGTLKPYVHIMRNISDLRVRIGGALGPVAAFLYVIGFSALPFTASGDFVWLVWVVALLLSFALICGGAYHSQFVFLSLVAKVGHEDLYDPVSDSIMFLSKFAIAPMYLGFIVLGIAIVLGQTIFPVWFVVFTPLVTSFLGFVWLRVPQPARCVLFGGWYNLVFTIMFLAMLLWVL